MIVLHGLRACDTCRKALRDLRESGRDVRLRDLREEPPTDGELARWTEALGPAILNRRSTTWRQLDETERARPAAALLRAHPTLVKRPVVEAPQGLALGWTPAARDMLGLGT
jgi:arsenate reductase